MSALGPAKKGSRWARSPTPSPTKSRPFRSYRTNSASPTPSSISSRTARSQPRFRRTALARCSPLMACLGDVIRPVVASTCDVSASPSRVVNGSYRFHFPISWRNRCFRSFRSWRGLAVSLLALRLLAVSSEAQVNLFVVGQAVQLLQVADGCVAPLKTACVSLSELGHDVYTAVLGPWKRELEPETTYLCALALRSPPTPSPTKSRPSASPTPSSNAVPMTNRSM